MKTIVHDEKPDGILIVPKGLTKKELEKIKEEWFREYDTDYPPIASGEVNIAGYDCDYIKL